MASDTDNARDVPMSVRMRRVLDSVKRMTPSERANLMVNAGLMTEAEVPQAVDRLTAAEKARRQRKVHRHTTEKKAAKPTHE